MRAAFLKNNVLQLRECAEPACRPGEVVIRTAYAGINRADLLQTQGRYPLPECGIPGMEVSGIIEACGSEVTQFTPGDAVCTLISEGGYAEKVAAPAALTFALPPDFNLEYGAALPEACFTAWISLVWQAKLAVGETFLMHGGASGIGIITLQIAQLLGATVSATAGSDAKCALCTQAGATHAINYRNEDFVSVIKTMTDGRGVDVIMDMVGGDYFARNLECLALNGRLCIIAFLQGAQVSVNLAPVLLKRLSIMGSTLRTRPLEDKSRIAAQLRERIWPSVLNGSIKPVIDRIFPLEDVEKALARMDQGLNCGKILLKVSLLSP